MKQLDLRAVAQHLVQRGNDRRARFLRDLDYGVTAFHSRQRVRKVDFSLLIHHPPGTHASSIFLCRRAAEIPISAFPSERVPQTRPQRARREHVEMDVLDTLRGLALQARSVEVVDVVVVAVEHVEHVEVGAPAAPLAT
jgi:hypothetical protein